MKCQSARCSERRLDVLCYLLRGCHGNEKMIIACIAFKGDCYMLISDNQSVTGTRFRAFRIFVII